MYLMYSLVDFIRLEQEIFPLVNYPQDCGKNSPHLLRYSSVCDIFNTVSNIRGTNEQPKELESLEN